MAGLIERRPLVGIASAVVFAALGGLLTGIDTDRIALSVTAAVLFKVLGYFLFFVSALSCLNTVQALLKRGDRDHRGR